MITEKLNVDSNLIDIFVIPGNTNVNWIKQARWVNDGKYYTPSGVSAGMDMTLGVISDIYGADFARKAAFEIE